MAKSKRRATPLPSPSPPPPASVGAKLQKARERQGVSLRQVADSTKVSVTVLQALERNDVSRVPGGVFARGFVRSFASAVGLDPEAIVAEFVAQSPPDSVQDGYPAAKPVEESQLPELSLPKSSIKTGARQPPTLFRLTAVGVLAGALVVYLGITKRWLPWAVSSGEAATVTQAAGSDRNAVQPQRSAETSARPAPSTLADLPGPAVVLGHSPAAPASPSVGDPTPAAASPPPTESFEDDASPAAAEPAAVAARVEKPDAAPPVGGPLAVVLSVTNPSWVIVTVDGQKAVSRMFEVGEQETLEARRDLVLTTADAGAIVMTLNGARVKSLGRTHETVTARIDRANFRDYLRRADSPPPHP